MKVILHVAQAVLGFFAYGMAAIWLTLLTGSNIGIMTVSVLMMAAIGLGGHAVAQGRGYPLIVGQLIAIAVSVSALLVMQP